MIKKELKLFKKLKEGLTEEFIEKMRKLGVEESIIEKFNEKPEKKQVIADKRKCSASKKDGLKCGLFVSSNDKCWAHLSSKEKSEYRK